MFYLLYLLLLTYLLKENRWHTDEERERKGKQINNDRQTDRQTDRETAGVLSRDAGERFIRCFWCEVHESNHLTEMYRVPLVDCVTDIRQLTPDLRRRTIQHTHTQQKTFSLDCFLSFEKVKVIYRLDTSVVRVTTCLMLSHLIRLRIHYVTGHNSVTFPFPLIFFPFSFAAQQHLQFPWDSQGNGIPISFPIPMHL